jgi:uncharacterized membrane protein (UPF0127 family)
MKKKKWLLVCIFIVILGVFFLSIKVSRTKQLSQQSSQSIKIAISVNSSEVPRQLPLTVEVVSNPARIARGLSGRSEIGSDGMLFVFPAAGEYQFWMKEMLFALDIIWIRDGRVTGIEANVPFPDPATPLNKLPRYSPPGLVDMVLEVPAGFAARQGIEVGSEVARASDTLE